jgi:tRNA threonylcarbamoyladenosine biosynthesis protein TsaE
MSRTELRVVTYGHDDTRGLAARLARHLQPGAVVCLQGELGSGKTTFAQGLGRGLGVTRPVISPTFTLIHEYPMPGGGHFVHMDFYRLEEAEVARLGIQDYLVAGNIVAIEWPARAKRLLPAGTVSVGLERLGNDQRLVVIEADEGLLAAFEDRPAEGGSRQ